MVQPQKYIKTTLWTSKIAFLCIFLQPSIGSLLKQTNIFFCYASYRILCKKKCCGLKVQRWFHPLTLSLWLVCTARGPCLKWYLLGTPNFTVPKHTTRFKISTFHGMSREGWGGWGGTGWPCCGSRGTASVPRACSLGCGHGAPTGAGAVARWGVQGAWAAAGSCAAGLVGRNQALLRNRRLEGGKDVCDPILEMEPRINIYLLNRWQQAGRVHEQLEEESPDPSVSDKPESTKSRKMANS